MRQKNDKEKIITNYRPEFGRGGHAKELNI